MECFLVKDDLGVLRPARSEDADKIKKMKRGESYKAKITMPRNSAHNAKFRVMLQIVFDNLPEELSHIQTADHLLYDIKFLMGFGTWRVDPNGNQEFVRDSINFASMDQAAFELFYSRSIDVILARFMPGTNREALETEILNFI